MFMISIMLPISFGLTIGGTLLTSRLGVHETAVGIRPAATSMAYRDVAMVGLVCLVVSLAIMALFRSPRSTPTPGSAAQA
jgi:hypothetical protein